MRGHCSGLASPSCANAWNVPQLVDAILDAPYIDLCPPSFQDDAVADFRNRVALRPSAGDVVSGQPLPWDDATLRNLPHPQTIHLTLGTIFHGLTEVFETVLAGLRPLPVNVIVALGPDADTSRLGQQPRQRSRHRLRAPRRSCCRIATR